MPTTEYKIGMTCEGCSGAITRILKKMDGVEEVECDIEAKKVLVKGASLPADDAMTEKLKKWGDAAQKSVEYVGRTD